MTKEDIRRNLLYYKNLLLNRMSSKEDIAKATETFDKAIDAVEQSVDKKLGKILSMYTDNIIRKERPFIVRNTVSGLEFKARNIRLSFPVNGPFVSQSAYMSYEDTGLVEKALNTHLLESVSGSRFPEEKKAALKKNEKFEILEPCGDNDYQLAVTLFNVIPDFVDYTDNKLSFRFEHQIFEMGTTYGEKWYTEMAEAIRVAERNNPHFK